MAKILLADDEPSVRDTVSFYLRREGHEVLLASDGREAVATYRHEHPDLVILDVMMPGANGFDVCATIRGESEAVPIIMLSAKSDLVDKGTGFKNGCDDYMGKPFEPEELIMRVSSCLRRVAQPAQSGAVVTSGDLEVRLQSREVLRDGAALSLTAKEFELLAYLAENPGIVLSHHQILARVWGEGYIGDAGVVAVYVRRVREKIEADPKNPKHILTDWGVGYRFL